MTRRARPGNKDFKDQSRSNRTLQLVKEIIPLSYIFLLVLSIIENTLYYSQFELNFWAHIDIVEVLTLWLDKGTYKIFTLIGGVVTQYILIRNVNDNRIYNLTMLGIVSISIVLITVNSLIFPKYLMVYWYAGFAISLLYFGVNKKWKSIDSLLIGMIFVIIFAGSLEEAYSLKKESCLKAVVTFEKPNEADLIIYDSLVLIGETRNYAFIFNRNSKITQTLSKKGVASIFKYDPETLDCKQVKSDSTSIPSSSSP
ncbi:MAG: hypothetical protein AAGF85_00740 [Bacteroidota bacterium]